MAPVDFLALVALMDTVVVLEAFHMEDNEEVEKVDV
jgi:hypothetical protein